MTVYLDQAAAARPAPEAIEFYFARVRENYANQEAAHRLGHDARQQLDRAAEELSLALTGDPGWKVIWGGCGTELFNLFADSPLAAGKCAITSPLEHPALLAVLRRSAAELRLLRPDRCGRILPEELPAGDLLALHQVQSELGTIQPIGPLAEAFRRNSPAGILFVDAIQGAAKLPFPREADIVAVSGRKFGAPGGGAALLIRPAFRGGKTLLEFARRWRHELYRGCRPEVPALLALAFAAGLRVAKQEEAARRIGELNAAVRRELENLPLPGGGRIRCTVPPELASPYLLHLLLPGIQSGVMVRMLSAAGVMAAAGSACASESREPSAALRAIGLNRNDAYSGLRIGFGFDSTAEEAKKLVEALKDALKNY